jgi:hypothetical protein
MVNALMCSSLIQLMDTELCADAHESSNDNDVGSNALCHDLLCTCHEIVAMTSPGIAPGWELLLTWSVVDEQTYVPSPVTSLCCSRNPSASYGSAW